MVGSKTGKPTPRLCVRISAESEDLGQKGFDIHALPDSGAQKSIIGLNLVRKYNLSFNTRDQDKLVAANELPMKCEGTTCFQVQVNEHCAVCEASGQIHTCASGPIVMVFASVSSDLKDDLFLSWHDLQLLRVLNAHFPH